MKFGMGTPRVYWHNNKPVPSVSTITQIFKSGIPFNWTADRAMNYVIDSMLDIDFNLEDLLIEAKDDAEKYMNDCSDLGTAIHGAISNSFITGERDNELPDDITLMDTLLYKKLLNNAWKWIDKFNVDPVLVEKAMSNDRFAGTLDLFCELDSEAFEVKRWCTARGVEFPQPHRRVKTLLDWKATASYYDDMPVKLSGYYRLLKEYGYEPEAALIGRFSRKTGSLNIKDYTDELPDAYITFDLACQLFHHNFKKFLEETEQEADRQRMAKAERKHVQ